QNLNNVLERIEGHFIRGYGDSQKPDVEIDLLAGAVSQADGFLREHEESKARLERVSALISGFETPYGMELLSSVHWVAVHGDPKAKSVEAVTSAVHRWNDRKRNMFKPEHIVAAWERLNEERWV
ncbi:MAG: Appr-1-p processing protein, partial [Acidobacteriota bacterium]